jgi:hypothetical protein
MAALSRYLRGLCQASDSRIPDTNECRSGWAGTMPLSRIGCIALTRVLSMGHAKHLGSPNLSSLWRGGDRLLLEVACLCRVTL